MSYMKTWLAGGLSTDGTNPNIISGGLKMAGNTVIPSTRYAISLANGTVYPVVPPTASVVAKTASGNITSTNFNKNITNTGASGTIALALPAAASYAGKVLRVQITVAQIVRLTPASGEAIYLGGSGVAGKYLQIAGVIGNFADIYCDGTQWLVTGYSGVLTKEA